MMTRDASRDALQQHVDSGASGDEATRVVRAIIEEPGTTREVIRRVGGIDARNGSARVNHLHLAGLVVYGPKRKCNVTGREAHVLVATEAAHQFLRTGVMPEQRPTERQRLVAVLTAAREFLTAAPGDEIVMRQRLKNVVRSCGDIDPDAVSEESVTDEWKDTRKPDAKKTRR